MKVCTVEHSNPGFGFIPVGSIWDDDSPFVDDAHFGDVLDEKPKPTRRHYGPKIESET